VVQVRSEAVNDARAAVAPKSTPKLVVVQLGQEFFVVQNDFRPAPARQDPLSLVSLLVLVSLLLLSLRSVAALSFVSSRVFVFLDVSQIKGLQATRSQTVFQEVVDSFFVVFVPSNAGSAAATATATVGVGVVVVAVFLQECQKEGMKPRHVSNAITLDRFDGIVRDAPGSILRLPSRLHLPQPFQVLPLLLCEGSRTGHDGRCHVVMESNGIESNRMEWNRVGATGTGTGTGTVLHCAVLYCIALYVAIV